MNGICLVNWYVGKFFLLVFMYYIKNRLQFIEEVVYESITGERFGKK